MDWRDWSWRCAALVRRFARLIQNDRFGWHPKTDRAVDPDQQSLAGYAVAIAVEFPGIPRLPLIQRSLAPQRGRPSSSGSRHPRRIAALALEPVQPVPVLVPVRVRLVSVPVRAPAPAGCLLAQRRPHRRHRARSALGSRTIRWSSRLSQPASPTVRTCVSRRSAVRHTGSGTTCSTAARTPRRNRISAGLLARPPRADCMGHSPVAAAGQR